MASSHFGSSTTFLRAAQWWDLVDVPGNSSEKAPQKGGLGRRDGYQSIVGPAICPDGRSWHANATAGRQVSLGPSRAWRRGSGMTVAGWATCLLAQALVDEWQVR